MTSAAMEGSSATPPGSKRPSYAWDLEDERFKLPVSHGRWFYCRITNTVFELGDQVGSGAAAVVFKCRRVLPPVEPGGSPTLDMSQEFAAKVMDLRCLRLRADYEREKEKLRREVSILSTLHHPCIVNLVHVIETHEELFLVMELVQGGELFYKIIEHGALTEDQTRYVLLQILYALQYMHSKGVIHRDLKPENILIAEEPAPGFFRVQVADFGLAKLVINGVSAAKTFVGTPQYWAPEVIDCSSSSHVAYGPEVDLWSLGCVIYVMLGGAYPFDTRLGPVDVLIKNAQYHFRYTRFQRVSDNAKNLIRGLLTVDPKKRLKLEGVFKHPWLESYRTPESVPPLPVLYPLPSSYPAAAPLSVSACSVLGPVKDTTTVAIPSQASIPPNILYDNGPLAPVSAYYDASGAHRGVSSVQVTIPEQVELPDPFSRQATRRFFPRPPAACQDGRAIVPMYTKAWMTSREQSSDSSVGDTTATVAAVRPIPEYPDGVPAASGCPFPDNAPVVGPPNTATVDRWRLLSGRPVHSSASQQPRASLPLQPKGGPGRPEREDFAKQAEIIFNFEELLCLQISIMKKFHWAYIALRSSPKAVKQISQCISEARNVQLESTAVVTQFEATCSSVLGILPDLSLAVSERQVDLAICLFEDIRSWVAGLRQQVEAHQEHVAAFIQHVNDVVEAVRSVKLAADKTIMATANHLSTLEPFVDQAILEEVSATGRVESVVSEQTLTPRTVGHSDTVSSGFQSIDAPEPLRVGSVTSDDAFTKRTRAEEDVCLEAGSRVPSGSPTTGSISPPQDGVKEQRASTAGVEPANDEPACRGAVERPSPSPDMTANSTAAEGLQRWYDGVKDTVFQQLEDLATVTLHKMSDEAFAPASTVTVEVDMSDVKGFKRPAIFRRPDHSTDMSEESASMIAHELLDLLFISPASWIECHRRAAAQKRLEDGPAVTSDSSGTADREGGSLPPCCLTQAHPHHHHHHHCQPTCTELPDGTTVTPLATAADTHRIKQYKQHFYNQALRTSELLIRAMDELRRIDQILRKSTSFWLNLTTVIERLCQMKIHAERLLRYTVGSSAFTERFYERLGDYHRFWSALRDQAHDYVEQSAVKLAAMDEFAVALASAAVRRKRSESTMVCVGPRGHC